MNPHQQAVQQAQRAAQETAQRAHRAAQQAQQTAHKAMLQAQQIARQNQQQQAALLSQQRFIAQRNQRSREAQAIGPQTPPAAKSKSSWWGKLFGK